MSKIVMVVDESGEAKFAASNDLDMQVTGWCNVFTPKHGEWEIVVTYSTRQDGKAGWAVMKVTVDSGVEVRHGLHPYSVVPALINGALRELVA